MCTHHVHFIRVISVVSTCVCVGGGEGVRRHFHRCYLQEKRDVRVLANIKINNFTATSFYSELGTSKYL